MTHAVLGSGIQFKDYTLPHDSSANDRSWVNTMI